MADNTTHELDEKIQLLQKTIRQYPDFPKKGILFEDIFSLYKDVNLQVALLDALEMKIHSILTPEDMPDVIVGLDARGFLMGPPMALRFKTAFVPVRKEGKLPGDVVTAKYEKEYGADTFAMQADAIKPGQKVLVLDDLIATGGSAAAAGSLVKQLGGRLLAYVFIIELVGLNGRNKLDAPVHTLMESQS